jgi:multisubunit Na+/H+ antiporter MnhE subunit
MTGAGGWIWMRRALNLVLLGGFMAVQLTRANVLVAWKVLGPLQRMRAAVVTVPIQASTPLEVAVLTALLSLTPGTLPLEVDDREHHMRVHVLHARSVDAVRDEVRRLETRVLAVLR